MNENTGYMRYIRLRAARGKEKMSLQLFPNQATNLKHLGFIVTPKGRPKRYFRVHEKYWYQVEWKGAAIGTEAWKMYSLVLAHRRGKSAQKKSA